LFPCSICFWQTKKKQIGWFQCNVSAPPKNYAAFSVCIFQDAKNAGGDLRQTIRDNPFAFWELAGMQIDRLGGIFPGQESFQVVLSRVL